MSGPLERAVSARTSHTASAERESGNSLREGIPNETGDGEQRTTRNSKETPERPRPSLARPPSSDGAQSQSGSRKAELFFIVRPPPSALGHRLNLQVQLINTSGSGNGAPGQSGVSTGNQRSRYASGLPSASSSGNVSRISNGNMSFGAVAEASVSGAAGNPLSISRTTTRDNDGDTTDEDTPLYKNTSNLSRTTSARSNRSINSLTSSSGSLSASGTRKMLPWYNLEFHALQPSVITDAGTDAKIAKIHKRGVEVLDLATLDPVILGQHTNIPTFAIREASRKQLEALQQAQSGTGFAAELREFKPTNILSKFKRMSFRGPSPSSLPPPSANEKVSKTASGEGKRGSMLFGQTPVTFVPPISVVPLFREVDASPAPTPTGFAFKDLKLPAVSNQTLVGDGNTTPLKHAPGYVWIVRTFHRKDLQERAGTLYDVTVEWHKRKRRKVQHLPIENHTVDLRRHSTQDDTYKGPRLTLSPSKTEDPPPSPRATQSCDIPRATSREVRISTDKSRNKSNGATPSTSPTRPSPMEFLSPNRFFKSRGSNQPQPQLPGGGATLSPQTSRSAKSSKSVPSNAPSVHDEDSGDDSDPEDSETPWMCDLVVRRPMADSPTLVSQRVFLGKLTPAPHHPRLIGHLAVPLSLGPVTLEQSASSSSARKHEDLASLSVEELKDLMAVTGLWLVVRENLGLSGTHKARKNDGGWRLATPAALKG